MDSHTIKNLLDKALKEKDNAKLRMRVEIIVETLEAVSPVNPPSNPSFTPAPRTEDLTASHAQVETPRFDPNRLPPQPKQTSHKQSNEISRNENATGDIDNSNLGKGPGFPPKLD